MIAILWKFQAKGGREHEFEQIYGADGAWAQLFRSSKEFRGTELLASSEQSGDYVTIDRWASFEAFQQFLKQHGEEYRALDVKCAAVREQESRIGVFATANNEQPFVC